MGLNDLWFEELRPRSVKEMILPPRIKTAFTKYVNEKNFPHLLLQSSSPGTGKTSVAKALCEVIDADYLYINASSENGIDVLRSKILKFATSMGVFSTGGMKVVILDEVDGTSKDFQRALRPVMEEYSAYCRFILTANSIGRLEDAIVSRCEGGHFSFDFSPKDQEAMKAKFTKRMSSFLKLKDVVCDEDVLTQIIEKYYPDMRTIIGVLSKFSDMNNGVINGDIFTMEIIDDAFYKMILERQFTKAKYYVYECGFAPESIIESISMNYLPMIEDNPGKYAQSLITINDYAFKSAFVNNKHINLLALIMELVNVQ